TCLSLTNTNSSTACSASKNEERKMKTKTLKKDKVNIITLGCSKNMVDSEVLSGHLLAGNVDVVHENTSSDHNIVIVNTCGFIEKAKEESINTILDQVRLKQK